ncbi:conserved hypothetical protein [Verticillium alfalfae VaMs.102]|uniref:Coupling of ubiquitin conjugation to ER degradation protein 1 n=1 Tax=Verticillium alfalfae (strain VaMs.102 / ATCC MYA-4576 / FGSC 10136) TaxID=526221 RepID=C9S8P1_VERA1|nr:conserved hypothetical protein [Verticillium alfalfae VaMs.102]EEY14933.1 conserved hypothetical protein [Verticillium alfalfae VaMs.102]
MVKDDSQTISVPYLLVLLVLAAAILRLLFFSNSSGDTPPAGRHNPLNVLRARETAVERIQQMFPQVERRTILWDLQRNGGNVQTTSERILAGRIETVSSSVFLFFLSCLLCRLPSLYCSKSYGVDTAYASDIRVRGEAENVPR